MYTGRPGLLCEGVVTSGDSDLGFEFVDLVEGVGDPLRVRAHLTVPRNSIGDAYRPAESLERISVNGKDFLRFGSIGAFGSALFDPNSGHVVEWIHDSSKVGLVNTSIDAFSECAKAFVEKFPLSDMADEDERDERDNAIAREIEGDVRRIDPEAYFEGGFWYEIRWSVAIGDFSD